MKIFKLHICITLVTTLLIVNLLAQNNALRSTLIRLGNGIYSVIVTNESGCGTWYGDFIVGDVVIGIDEESDYLFELYPNPTRNFLNLGKPMELGEEYIIEMYDARGRAVYSKQSNDGTQHVLDVNRMSQGM